MELWWTHEGPELHTNSTRKWTFGKSSGDFLTCQRFLDHSRCCCRTLRNYPDEHTMAKDVYTNVPMGSRSQPNLKISNFVCPSAVKIGTMWHEHYSSHTHYVPQKIRMHRHTVTACYFKCYFLTVDMSNFKLLWLWVPAGNRTSGLGLISLVLVNDCHSDVSPVNNSNSDGLLEVAMRSYFYLLARIDIWCMNWKELGIWIKTQKEFLKSVKKLWNVKHVYCWYLFETSFSLLWQKHVLHCKNINLLISKWFNGFNKC